MPVGGAASPTFSSFFPLQYKTQKCQQHPTEHGRVGRDAPLMSLPVSAFTAATPPFGSALSSFTLSRCEASRLYFSPIYRFIYTRYELRITAALHRLAEDMLDPEATFSSFDLFMRGD